MRRITARLCIRSHGLRIMQPVCALAPRRERRVRASTMRAERGRDRIPGEKRAP